MNKVIPRNEYFSTLYNATPERVKYFHYRHNEFNKWNFIDLWENLSYLYAYMNEILKAFVLTWDIKLFEKRCNRFIEFYWKTKAWWMWLVHLKTAYLYSKQYDKAWDLIKHFPYHEQYRLEDVLFYSYLDKDFTLNAKDFINIFWQSTLTKFWNNNIEWIHQVMQIILDDFQNENGMNIVKFFCKDLTLDQSKINIEDYSKFFKKREKFEEYIEFDMKAHYSKWTYTKLESIILFDNLNLEEWCIFFDDLKINDNFDPSVKVEYIVPKYTITNAFKNKSRDLLRECENILREELWIPKIWEWRVSETELFYKLKTYFDTLEVIHHWRPDRLGRQHLDIYIPDLNIGIEYQGKQHQEPVAYFWGEEAFEKQQKRDKTKQKKCKKNNCKLIYVYEWYDIEKLFEEINSYIS